MAILDFRAYDFVEALVCRPDKNYLTIKQATPAGFIEGTVSHEGTNYKREVLLFAEVGSDRGARPGNLALSNLVLRGNVFSDPDTGYFRFDNLSSRLLYTVISCDADGLWDPAIKSGLSVSYY